MAFLQDILAETPALTAEESRGKSEEKPGPAQLLRKKDDKNDLMHKDLSLIMCTCQGFVVTLQQLI